MCPSLWRSTAPCVSSLEDQSDVDGQPRSILLHEHQHHQDVPDNQGGQCLPDLISLSRFFQPTEFTQLDHEKRFKFVLKALFVLITLNVVLFFVFAPGALFDRVSFLTGGVFEQDTMPKSAKIFLVFCNGGTVLVMITSEIFARAMRPTTTIVHPICSAGFIINHIPFLSLNFSIALPILVHVVTSVFFESLEGPFYLYMSVLLTTLIVTNKLARKHLASRLRQQIDTFTIGGNNTVPPFVEIALVPLRGQTGVAPTLVTPTRATE